MGTDLIAVDHRNLGALGDVGDHAVAQFRFPRVIGRRGQVDDQITLAGQFLHRVVAVADAGELGAPDVLADGQPNPFSRDGDDAGFGSRAEVTLFIEHIVGRQQTFVVAGDDLTARDGHRGVGERRAGTGIERFDTAQDGW